MAGYRIPGERINDGIIMYPIVTPEVIDIVSRIDMTEDHILMASYPKIGSTWLHELVWLLCNNGDLNTANALPAIERIPYLEHNSGSARFGFEMLQNMTPPFVMKTHLRSETYKTQIEAGKVKIIIGIRNPKDTLVSFYHFYRMNTKLGNFSGTWDDFFELYKTQRLLNGDYFDWYSNWLRHKDKPNVLVVKYEDMHRRMSEVIDNLLQFLGKTLPENVIADIREHVAFDNMSCNDMVNRTLDADFDANISPFLRKGTIGDWKNYFSEDQSALVDKAYKETIEPLGVTLEFE